MTFVDALVVTAAAPQFGAPPPAAAPVPAQGYGTPPQFSMSYCSSSFFFFLVSFFK